MHHRTLPFGPTKRKLAPGSTNFMDGIVSNSAELNLPTEFSRATLKLSPPVAHLLPPNNT